jgi:hypothetical protein
MRYRLPLLVLLVLPLAQCSCQRDPGTDHGTPAAAIPPAGEASTSAPVDAPAATRLAAASARGELAAITTLHEYLRVLPEADRRRADAYWAGGGPGARPGDAALRAIPDLRSMRIQNERPLALDRESPPRAYEIPVRLRLDTSAGPGRMQGAYRLRARADGQGWEITSASLQPVLD